MMKHKTGYFFLFQEQAAFTRYNEALMMIKEKDLEAARVILQELLEHNFLVKVNSMIILSLRRELLITRSMI